MFGSHDFIEQMRKFSLTIFPLSNVTSKEAKAKLCIFTIERKCRTEPRVTHFSFYYLIKKKRVLFNEMKCKRPLPSSNNVFSVIAKCALRCVWTIPKIPQKQVKTLYHGSYFHFLFSCSCYTPNQLNYWCSATNFFEHIW